MNNNYNEELEAIRREHGTSLGTQVDSRRIYGTDEAETKNI